MLEKVRCGSCVARALRNAGQGAGLLQELICGGVQDISDIAFAAAVAERIAANKPEALAACEQAAMKFGVAMEI